MKTTPVMISFGDYLMKSIRNRPAINVGPNSYKFMKYVNQTNEIRTWKFQL